MSMHPESWENSLNHEEDKAAFASRNPHLSSRARGRATGSLEAAFPAETKRSSHFHDSAVSANVDSDGADYLSKIRTHIQNKRDPNIDTPVTPGADPRGPLPYPETFSDHARWQEEIRYSRSQ